MAERVITFWEMVEAAALIHVGIAAYLGIILLVSWILGLNIY